MQLLVILALLLYGGKNNAAQLIEEVKPVLEYVGGDDMREALKSAEEITSVLAAVKQFTAETSPSGEDTPKPSAATEVREAQEAREATEFHETFPLAPINEIADKVILNSLTEYIRAN